MPRILLPAFRAIAVSLALVASDSDLLRAQAPAVSEAKRLEIGHFHARAILQCATAGAQGAPIAILIAGTGGHGPEEAMPAAITRDGKETELLISVAQGLRAAGFHTLQWASPGSSSTLRGT